MGSDKGDDTVAQVVTTTVIITQVVTQVVTYYCHSDTDNSHNDTGCDTLLSQ